MRTDVYGYGRLNGGDAFGFRRPGEAACLAAGARIVGIVVGKIGAGRDAGPRGR